MNLSLTKKILLVVAIPFAIQLVFLGVMSQKLKKLSEAQIAEQRLAKVMMAGDLYYIGENQVTLMSTMYLVTLDENCRRRCFQVADDLVRVFNELADLWSGEPEKLKILKATYDDHMNGIRMARQIMLSAAAEKKETVQDLVGGSPFMHAFIRHSIRNRDFRPTPLRPVFEKEALEKQDKAAVLSSDEQDIYKIMMIGLLATVIASIGSGLWFSTSISRRLKVVLANISALVDSNSELRIVRGRDDEISKLNSAVVTTANKIREAKDFQTQTIAIISEELSNPLAEADAALASLKEHGFEEISEKGILRLQGARREISRLESLLAELVNLDIAGRALNIEEIDVGELVLDCAKLVEPLAKSKNLVVSHEVSDATIAYGDHDKIMQVLLNLLSNAVKYSSENGTIEIIVDQREQQIRVEVIDHGQGIPDEFHARIFQRFEQADTNQSKPASSGLGLVISKEIVESQNGQMGFTSKQGEGSTFWFSLPKSKVPEVKSQFQAFQSSSAGWKPTLWKKAILVVALPVVVQAITIGALWKFLQENSEKIAQFEKIPKITAIHAELLEAVTHAGFLALLYNLDRDAQSLQLEKIQRKRMTDKIAELEEITATSNGADSLNADLIKSVKAHLAFDDRLIKAKANANVYNWYGPNSSNKKENLYIDTQAPLQALIKQEYQLMDSTAKESEAIRRNFEVLLIASALTTSLLSAALGVSIVRSLTNRAYKISTAAIEFSEFRLLTEPTSGTDELAFVEKRLYEAEKKLMELETARTEIIGITSHELRTPLTSLMALTDLIENGIFGALNEQGELLLSKARLRIGELIVLITNMLDLEKMESGKILVSKQPIMIENVLEDVKGDTAKLAKDRGVNLLFNPCSIEVSADSRRVSQSLIAVIQSVIQRVPTLSEVQVEGTQTEDEVIISLSAPHGVAVKGFNNKNKEFAREKMAVSLARLTAQQHGGDFKINTFSKGRTMIMSLPRKRDGRAPAH